MVKIETLLADFEKKIGSKIYQFFSSFFSNTVLIASKTGHEILGNLPIPEAIIWPIFGPFLTVIHVKS